MSDLPALCEARRPVCQRRREVMEIQELKKLLQERGIVGAGGAGFPTYAKLDERSQVILMNCA